MGGFVKVLPPSPVPTRGAGRKPVDGTVGLAVEDAAEDVLVGLVAVVREAGVARRGGFLSSDRLDMLGLFACSRTGDWCISKMKRKRCLLVR